MNFLFLGLFAVTSLASTMTFADEIFEIHAKEFSGGAYNKQGEITVPAKECIFAWKDDSYYKDNLIVFLSSNDKRSANFNFFIPKDRLPLKEGEDFVGHYGYRVTYNDGVLKARLEGTDLGTLDVIKLHVSPDLKTIESGEGMLSVKRLIGKNKIFTALECKF